MLCHEMMRRAHFGNRPVRTPLDRRRALEKRVLGQHLHLRRGKKRSVFFVGFEV